MSHPCSSISPHSSDTLISVRSMTAPLSTPQSTPAQHESTIVTGKKLAVIVMALLLSLLLITLDQTILATALPHIASDFDAFSLQGWVASSFLLAQTVFILFYGQLLRIFPAKWILISAITLFETGSLVCGLARNVNMLMAGRTISGVGAAGIYVGMIQVGSQVSRLEDRPRLFGLFGVVSGLSSVIGPLIGGAFTDHVTWRWCFFINLPVGGVSILTVIFFLKSSPPLGSDPLKRSTRDLLKQILQLDYLGTVLIAGAVTCLVLALQWGGNIKSWDAKAVIICFIIAGVGTVAFISWEIYLDDRAMVPTRIFKSRSVYSLILYCFLTRFSFLLLSYYIPIFYQAVRHSSATESGIKLLPFILSVVVSTIISSHLVGKFGYYWAFVAGAPVFLAIGSGLLYTITTSSTSGAIIGFQIIAGVGVGMGSQNALLAIQVEFKNAPKLLAQATSMGSFGQFLGGTVGLGVAEPVFASQLSKYLLIYAPDAPTIIVKESPTDIYKALPASMIPGVVQAYTHSLRIVFIIGVPIAGLALIVAMFIKNIKIEKSVPPGTLPQVEIEKGTELQDT